MGVFIFAVDYILARVESDGLNNPVYTDQASAGIIDLVQAAKATGWEVVVATNQAGPAYRFCFGDNGSWPTVKDTCLRLITIARATGTADCTWFLSTWDDSIWGRIPEDEFEQADQAIQSWLPKANARVVYWFEHCDLPTPGVSGHPEWRMPGTKMLEEIMKAAQVSIDDVVMVAPKNSREARAAKALDMVTMTVPEMKEMLKAYMPKEGVA